LVPPHARTELDRWILSRLHSTILAVDVAYAEYDATRAARALEEFIEELSNWYIRRSRPRFWAAKKSDGERDGHEKLCAYQTTFECLDAVARMMSPLAPFFGDWLFRALREGAAHEEVPSVHMADFPLHDPGLVDPALETRMGLARTVVSLVLLLRNKAKINVRQPLQRILLVEGLSGVRSEVVETVRDIILDEVNIRDIEFIQDAGAVVRRSAKANFKRLGGRLGKRMKAAAGLIAALGAEDINTFLRDGRLVLDLAGEPLSLDAEDLEIQSEEVGGWSVAQEGRVTVALDTAITDELRQQGYARELVNRIQQMRKALDLPLTERIALEIKAPAVFREAVGALETYVQAEVLAISLAFSEAPTGSLVEAVEIGEFAVTLGLTRRGMPAA